MGFLPLGLPYPRFTQQPRMPLVRNPATGMDEYRPGWWEIGVGESGQGKLPTGNNFYGMLYKYVSSESVTVICEGWLNGYGGGGSSVGGRSLAYFESIVVPEDDEPEEGEDYQENESDYTARIMEDYDPHWFGRNLDREKLLENMAPWARTESDRRAWLDALGYWMGYDIVEVLRIRVAPSDSRAVRQRRRQHG